MLLGVRRANLLSLLQVQGRCLAQSATGLVKLPVLIYRHEK